MKKIIGMLFCIVLALGATACNASVGEAVEFNEQTVLGRWVKNGEAGGVVCIIEENGYTLYDEGEAETITTGSYVLEETLVNTLSGGQIKTLCAVLTPADGRSDHGGILRPDDSGKAVYIYNGNTFYIREDVLKSAAGKILVQKYRMVRATWFDRETYESALYFDMDGTLTRRRFDSMGAYETAKIGTWSVTADNLAITLTDAASVSYTLPVTAVTVDGVSYSFEEAR